MRTAFDTNGLKSYPHGDPVISMPANELMEANTVHVPLGVESIARSLLDVRDRICVTKSSYVRP